MSSVPATTGHSWDGQLQTRKLDAQMSGRLLLPSHWYLAEKCKVGRFDFLLTIRRLGPWSPDFMFLGLE